MKGGCKMAILATLFLSAIMFSFGVIVGNNDRQYERKSKGRTEKY